MAQEISCPNCQQGFGKDVENLKNMQCDNCEEEYYNKRGFDEEEIQHFGIGEGPGDK